jgi:hypothetical protein
MGRITNAAMPDALVEPKTKPLMKRSRPTINARANKQKPKDPPKPDSPVAQKFTFLDDFYATRPSSHTVRESYPVYLIGLMLDQKDLQHLAYECLTGGPDDHDTDCCYIDTELREAFVVQAYVADSWSKPEAPAKKADDLLTALTWLLNKKLKEIPAAIRQKAQELQAALEAKEIETLHLLYVHNCRETGKNVSASLGVVARSASQLLSDPSINVSARQLGLDSAQRLFNSITKNIVIEDKIELKVASSFPEKGKKWRSIATTLNGQQVHDLYSRFGDDLYSANLRGFLNMLGRRTSINSRMMDSLKNSAKNFWVFNNGITLLTKKLTSEEGVLTLTGVSVINGAQTTGVIGLSKVLDAKKIRVPCRIVECNDDSIIRDIITFNNAQNAIKSSDFRSRDSIQVRLANDFNAYGISYAHRRDGTPRLPSGAVVLDSVAAFVCAFHGDFQTAARNRRMIFEDEELYIRVFRRDVSVEHLYLVQTLADAIGEIKDEYASKDETGNLQELEKKCFELLRHSPSKYFLLSVIGGLDEQVLDIAVADRYSWKVNGNLVKADRKSMIVRWRSVVEAILPLIAGQTGDDPYVTVRSAKIAADLPSKIAPLIAAVKKSISASMVPIRDSTACA